MSRETPVPDFYPSVKVVLTVRFEEFDQAKLLTQAPKKKLAQTLKGTKSDRTELKVIPDTNAPEGVRRFVLSLPGSDTAHGGPTNPTSSGDGLTFAVGGIIPKTLTLKRNSVRIADQCEMTIRWVDFPIDPRVIRACAVEVYIGTIPATDYAAGIRGALRSPSPQGGQTEGEPLHLVADTDAKGRSNLRFQGWVDVWDMDWPDGEATLKLACVDNTRLLIDQIAPSNVRFDNTIPLDEAIAKYLSHFPQMAGLAVEYRGDKDETTAPALKTAQDQYFSVKDIGPAPAKAGAPAGGEQLTVWDYVTDVCGTLSLFVRVEGTSIILQRPKNLLSRVSVRPDDQYTPRTISNVTYAFRMVVFGRNLTDLSVKRNFSRKAVKNVQVNCYDPSRKARLVGRYPKDPSTFQTAANPGDGKVDTKWTVYQVDGVRDQKTIDKIAEDFYHSVGRREIEASCKTRNLASWGGGNDDPDLLDLHAGDTIEFGVVRDMAAGTTQATENALKSLDLNVAELKRKGFPPAFAQAFAKAYNDAGFQREFRVREASIAWDVDKGVDIDISAVNFIEIRVGETTAQADASGTGAPTSANQKAKKPVVSP